MVCKYFISFHKFSFYSQLFALLLRNILLWYFLYFDVTCPVFWCDVCSALMRCVSCTLFLCLWCSPVLPLSSISPYRLLNLEAEFRLPTCNSLKSLSRMFSFEQQQKKKFQLWFAFHFCSLEVSKDTKDISASNKDKGGSFTFAHLHSFS